MKHSTLSEKKTQAGLLARRLAVYVMLLLGCYLLGQSSAASAAQSQTLKYRANDIHSLTAANMVLEQSTPAATGNLLAETIGLRAAWDEFQDVTLLEILRANPCNRNGRADETPDWHASSALAALRLSRAPPVV